MLKKLFSIKTINVILFLPVGKMKINTCAPAIIEISITGNNEIRFLIFMFLIFQKREKKNIHIFVKKKSTKQAI